MAMPKPDLRPHIAPRTIESLLCEAADATSHEHLRRMYPWADRFVFGLPLAPWQREFKWTLEQCQRFVGSAWSGGHLGSYLLTKFELVPGAGVVYKPMSNMVIDGQQRLTALEMYFRDEFAVEDEAGKPTLWSEVDKVDSRRFRNTIFSRGEVDLSGEMELRRLYDVLNFGGTPHEEHERALPMDRPRRG